MSGRDKVTVDIEGKIRSRIEAILINDAKSYAQLKHMATEDEAFDEDPFTEERNLYQRIINSYRSAVSEVNALLEENVGYLSGFYRIIESIKDKEDFQEICSLTVDCVLQDLGAEYCSIIFFTGEQGLAESLRFEGICEERKFICIHSGAGLLGGQDFEETLVQLVAESGDLLNISDVYREPRFNRVDFPGVVRSLLCLPIVARENPIGILVLSHSLPRFFTDNHIRVLRILAGIIAHLRILSDGRSSRSPETAGPTAPARRNERDVLSVAILDFETSGANGKKLSIDGEALQSIRRRITASTDSGESILLYDERQLVLLSPGTTAKQLPARASALQAAFADWLECQSEKLRNTRMILGFATCEEGQDLAQTLQTASLMMQQKIASSVEPN